MYSDSSQVSYLLVETRGLLFRVGDTPWFMAKPARTKTQQRTQQIETNTEIISEWYVLLRKSWGKPTEVLKIVRVVAT